MDWWREGKPGMNQSKANRRPRSTQPRSSSLGRRNPPTKPPGGCVVAAVGMIGVLVGIGYGVMEVL